MVPVHCVYKVLKVIVAWSKRWLCEWPLKTYLVCEEVSLASLMKTPFCSKKSAVSSPFVSLKLPSSGVVVYRKASERAPDSNPPKMRISFCVICRAPISNIAFGNLSSSSCQLF